MNAERIYRKIAKEINRYGSDGVFYRFKSGVSRNSYDEYGNEIELTDETQVTKHEVKYSSTKLKVEEQSALSLSDNSYRITILFKDEVLDITKGDVFEDNKGFRYSVELIDFIGDIGNKRMLIQVFVKQD